MNKNEILEKSKEENKNADPYEMEVNAKAHSYGMWSMLIFCVIVTFIKFIKEQRFDLSLVAMTCVLNAVKDTYRAVKLKEQKLVTTAILSCFTAVIWTALAVFQILRGII